MSDSCCERPASSFAVSARSAVVIPLVFCLTGCVDEHRQSVLHPVSPAASTISSLWWVMFAVCTAVSFLVFVLLAIAIFRRPKPDRDRPPLGSTAFIVGLGVVMPSVVLVALLVYSLQASVALRLPETDLTIEVIGHQWWWEVRYPDEKIITANELYIPAGVPVRIELSSADVIHSFWVPNLNGKMDMLPQHFHGQGRGNVFWLHANEPGHWRGQCAEYCGVQHAWMAFEVVALPADEFRAWVADRQEPPAVPDTEEVQRGREVFFSEQAGCQKCHAIRGTPANAQIGPDLTHIGARLTIGAGLLPNNRGNLGGWIANPQELKPGNLMPRTYLDSNDLQALITYLESLR